MYAAFVLEILDTLNELKADVAEMKANRLGWIWDQPTSHHGSSLASDDPPSDFKKHLLTYWVRGHPDGEPLIKCQVLDEFFPSGQVKAAHLFPKRKSAIMQARTGLHLNCMWNVKNGLLLHESIEAAFAQGRLSFIYNPLTKTFIVQVLDPSLRPARLSQKHPTFTRTYGDVHNIATLHLPEGKFPYCRILSLQAREAVKRHRTVLTEAEVEDVTNALTLSERLDNNNWSAVDETDIHFDLPKSSTGSEKTHNKGEPDSKQLKKEPRKQKVANRPSSRSSDSSTQTDDIWVPYESHESSSRYE